MTRPELRALTSVRSVFAWAVVLYHLRLSCAYWLGPSATTVLGKGYLAVDFFFLLSGFVIWLNYGARLRAGGGAWDFYRRRFARIWPLHAVMLAATLAMALLLLATNRPAPRFPLAALPLHLALVQDWGFTNPLAWNDPAWSISAEWAAYLLLPLAALALPRGRVPTPLIAAAAIAPLLLLGALFAAGGHDVLGADIGRYGVPRCSAEFASGCTLSTLWRRWRGRAIAAPLCWIVAATLAVTWGAGLVETFAVPPMFAAALLALALDADRPGHPLSGRAIHRLGEVSYATYLVHVPLFFAFKLAFVGDADRLPPWQAAIVIALILAASILLHDHVERTAQRWLNRRGAGHAPRPAKRITPPRSI